MCDLYKNLDNSYSYSSFIEVNDGVVILHIIGSLTNGRLSILLNVSPVLKGTVKYVVQRFNFDLITANDKLSALDKSLFVGFSNDIILGIEENIALFFKKLKSTNKK